jgi:hypothetical protein
MVADHLSQCLDESVVGAEIVLDVGPRLLREAERQGVRESLFSDPRQIDTCVLRLRKDRR